MSFEFFGSDFSLPKVNQANKSCKFLETKVPCSSSMNLLDIPLSEDNFSPVETCAPAVPVEEKKPRFRIVYGSFPSKKVSSPKSTVKKSLETVFHPYKNRANMNTRQAATKEKSAFSYPNLVFLALENAPNNQAYVSDIYEFLIHNFPFFATANNSWKNCVRNNISNSQMFEKVPSTELTNKYRGDLWKIKSEMYGKLLKGVKKTISKYSMEELKLRKDADLDDILAGRAGSKSSYMPKYPAPVPNSIIPAHPQNQMVYRPVVSQNPQMPSFAPTAYPPMPFPVYFNHPQFQHNQYPYYFNYNH